MPNGKPGDHPYTDILHRLRPVYSPKIDDLVREIVALSDERGRQQLADMLLRDYNDFAQPDLEKLEQTLATLFERLREDGAQRGWEF